MALLVRTLALLAMTVATVALEVVPLDMAQDSFDDQYRGCDSAMRVNLQSLYNSEYQNSPHFSRGWHDADAEWRKRGFPVSPLTSSWQAIALMAYTSQDLHKDFNAAVHTAGRSSLEYHINFPFKTLHYLLTDALQTLREAQHGQCHHVFRGVRGVRFQAQVGQRVRFGQFASTSLSKSVALYFGTDTIFEVHTCHGADIRHFSMYPDEEEVLIPPYETFEVTKVTWDGKSTWISLRSVGTYSKYNCEWL